jgi:hypothetical protein
VRAPRSEKLQNALAAYLQFELAAEPVGHIKGLMPAGVQATGACFCAENGFLQH